MNGTQLLVAVLTVAGSIVAAVVAAINVRPKVNAEARHADTTSDVAKSTDARLWVQEFRQVATAAQEEARAANDRAESARQEARQANARADQTNERCDDLVWKFNALLEGFHQCRDELAKYPGARIPVLPPGVDSPA